jgi:hypothetical protein
MRAASSRPRPAAALRSRPIAVAAGSARLAWLVGAALVVATTGAFASGSSAHQRPAAAPQAASVARAANSAPLPRRWVWPRVKKAALYGSASCAPGGRSS